MIVYIKHIEYIMIACIWLSRSRYDVHLVLPSRSTVHVIPVTSSQHVWNWVLDDVHLNIGVLLSHQLHGELDLCMRPHSIAASASQSLPEDCNRLIDAHLCGFARQQHRGTMPYASLYGDLPPEQGQYSEIPGQTPTPQRFWSLSYISIYSFYFYEAYTGIKALTILVDVQLPLSDTSLNFFEHRKLAYQISKVAELHQQDCLANILVFRALHEAHYCRKCKSYKFGTILKPWDRMRRQPYFQRIRGLMGWVKR